MKTAILSGEMLTMRPLDGRDVADILALAAAPEIAANTFVPQPYPPEAAREFVRDRQEKWRNDEDYVFALIEKRSEAFVGCMGIHPVHEHFRAEVGYWIGTPYWGRGYATEALRLLIRFGFERLKLNRIEAGHFAHNPASGRVMQKADMRYEGLRRKFVWHRDCFKDLHWYAILREEYLEDQQSEKKETAED